MTTTAAVSRAEATGAGGAALEIERVTKSYGTFVAVDDLTLTVPSGSFFALLGPSGCGKTTTLRMVAGAGAAVRGTLSIGGRDVTGTRAHQRAREHGVPELRALPHLTVGQNVAFGLKRSGASDVARRVVEGLDLVELSHLADRKPAQLSAGSSSGRPRSRPGQPPGAPAPGRAAGRADLKLRRQMQLELKRIQTEVGLTFVHVTHDQEEAMTMADTIAVMKTTGGSSRWAPRPTCTSCPGPRSSPTSSGSPTWSPAR